MRRAQFRITYEQLKELLELPEDAEIIGLFQSIEDMISKEVRVYVKHESLPRHKRGYGTLSIELSEHQW